MKAAHYFETSGITSPSDTEPENWDPQSLLSHFMFHESHSINKRSFA